MRIVGGIQQTQLGGTSVDICRRLNMKWRFSISIGAVCAASAWFNPASDTPSVCIESLAKPDSRQLLPRTCFAHRRVVAREIRFDRQRLDVTKLVFDSRGFRW